MDIVALDVLQDHQSVLAAGPPYSFGVVDTATSDASPDERPCVGAFDVHAPSDRGTLNVSKGT
eukprot:3561974-Alexandrium_andersonii.AAC.1